MTTYKKKSPNAHIKDFLKPNPRARTQQGYFDQNRTPQKYMGKRPIIYRSSYEYDAFIWADTSPNVLSWTTEPFPIEYRDFRTGKTHKYWIDLVVRMKDGKILLIEIKPYSQVPKTLNEVAIDATKRKNFQKWEACKEWCKMRHGYEFMIMTEKSLFALTGLSKYSHARNFK